MAKILTCDIKEAAKYYSADDKIVEIKKSDDETITAVIHPTISYKDYAQLVTDIIEGMFDGDEYIPFARSASFNINVIKYFTNLRVDNVKVVFEFVQNTGIMDIIFDTIGEGFKSELLRDVNEGVEYRKQKIYHSSKWNDVADTLNNFLEGFIKNIKQNEKAFKDFDPKKLVELANKLDKKSDSIAVNNTMSNLDKQDNKIIDIKNK